MLRVRLLLILFALALFGAGAHAQVTSLRLNSDLGDYIGGGQFTFLTPSDGTFSAQQNFDQGVSISFFGQPGTFWFFEFAAPNQQLLTVGTYAGATRFPFQDPSLPGLSVFGDGRGCNTLTGSFQVLEVAYGANNTIASFDATFGAGNAAIVLATKPHRDSLVADSRPAVDAVTASVQASTDIILAEVAGASTTSTKIPFGRRAICVSSPTNRFFHR